MNRDEVIEDLVGKYREALEEKDDEDLLGNTLERAREEAVEEMVERYQEHVEEMDDEDLLGDSLENQQRGYAQIQGQLRMPKASVGAPAAAANARVELVDEVGNVVQSVRSTAEGQYRFKNVDAGRYRVRVKKDGFAPVERAVQAQKAAESAASLDL